VKAVVAMPSGLQDTIRRINTIRNAIAHSFFPENKRDFKATRTVTYKGKNLFTIEGISLLDNDAESVISYLWPLAYESKGRTARKRNS